MLSPVLRIGRDRLGRPPMEQVWALPVETRGRRTMPKQATPSTSGTRSRRPCLSAAFRSYEGARAEGIDLRVRSSRGTGLTRVRESLPSDPSHANLYPHVSDTRGNVTQGRPYRQRGFHDQRRRIDGQPHAVANQPAPRKVCDSGHIRFDPEALWNETPLPLRCDG